MTLFNKIKVFFTFKREIEDIIQEAKMETSVGKPAWKSTEFYFNLASQIGIMWGAVSGFIPPKYAAIISTAGIALYTVARTISKAVTDIQNTKIVAPSSETATAVATVGQS